MNAKEELGVIREIDCGNRDCGRPVIWFTVDLLIGCVLIVLDWEEGKELVKQSKLYSLSSLVGRAVVMSESDSGTFTFKRIK